MVGRPSQWTGSGQEALPDGQEWSGDPHEGQGVFGRPSWIAGSGREAHPRGWSGREAFPEGREWLGGPP